MANEFKPLVPATFKGKATFSISNNRINRVPATSTGAATSYVASNDTRTTPRGSEVAPSNGDSAAGAATPKQLQPIVPRISIGPKASFSGASQKLLLNTSSNTKYLLVNTAQMKTVKRASTDTPPVHHAIKRPNNKTFTPILPYSPSSSSSSNNYRNSNHSTSVLPSRSAPGPALPKQPVTAAIDGGIYPRPKKPCNCTKSMCLKLYCDCFANGEFCNGCNCQNCHNNIQHESER